MSIVVITIPDPAKQEFVYQLQRETDQVSLIIIQSSPPRAWYRTWKDLLHPTHLLFGLWLRLRPAYRTALTWFRAIPTDPPLRPEWPAPTIWTDDVNNHQVKEKIAEQSPTVIAVWGSGLLDDQITALAPHVVNLHLGVAPDYRGALANQVAVARGDYGRVGYTIHDVNERADAGHIIASETATIHPDPRQTFSELNRRARQQFLDTTISLATNKPVPRQPQTQNTGHVSRMRDWTPWRRYQLAHRLLTWRANGKPPSSSLSTFVE